jgi:DNA-binding response OmpR family regulator
VNVDRDSPQLLVASRDAQRGRTLAAMLEDAGWRVRQADDTGVVEAVLGAAGADTAVVDVAGPTSSIGPLTIDRQRREVRVHGRDVAATRIEFAVLERLCERPDQVRSRADLGRAVWGRGWDGDPHVVDVHLSNLRRKLQRHAPELRFFHTARGEGFRLSDDLLGR